MLYRKKIFTAKQQNRNTEKNFYSKTTKQKYRKKSIQKYGNTEKQKNRY